MSLRNNLKSFYFFFFSPHIFTGMPSFFSFLLLSPASLFFPIHLSQHFSLRLPSIQCFRTGTFLYIQRKSSPFWILPFKHMKVDMRIMFCNWLLSVPSSLEKDPGSGKVAYTFYGDGSVYTGTLNILFIGNTMPQAEHEDLPWFCLSRDLL